MKVRTNAVDVLKQLQEYKAEVERKLTRAVIKFSYYATYTATQFTPIGDAQKYFSFYQSRSVRMGLKAEEGLARAGWQANTSGSFDFRQDYGQGTGQDAAIDAENALMGSFKLGDTVFIGNKGPYIGMLEYDNYSDQTHGNGILKPTMEEVVAIYSADFKQMFDAA